MASFPCGMELHRLRIGPLSATLGNTLHPIPYCLSARSSSYTSFCRRALWVYMLCAISIAHFWLLFIFGSFPTIDNTRSQRVSTSKEIVSKRRRTGFAPSKNFLLEQEGF